MRLILPTSRGEKLGSFSLARYPQTVFLGALDLSLLTVVIGAAARWILLFL